ncbi:MAG: hypothetical protein AB1394_01505 [Bacteroidota bacterium]
MPQGTYFTKPSNHHNYAYVKTGEVLLYVSCLGQSETTLAVQREK